MSILQKRIQSWAKHSGHIPNGATVYIGLPVTPDVHSKLLALGFGEQLNPGESLCPAPENGPVSRFNAMGREVPQRHLSMETAYRQAEWTWTEWHGDDSIERSRIVDIPYKRYPREQILPPSCYLVIMEANGQKFVVVDGPIINGAVEEPVLVHKVNLVLEIFGVAEILTEDFGIHQPTRNIRLDWEILPPGDMPWEQFSEGYLKPMLERVSKGKRPIVYDRLESVSGYEPSFRAIGANGYKGYIIFGFPGRNLYIFENALYGNATYVFEGEWERISQMTKAEILSLQLQKHRLVHRNGWHEMLREILG